jgi:hypothetical protein
VLFAVAVLVAAGCGREGKSAESPARREEALLAVAKCMREKGFDVPDPKPGERGLGFTRPPANLDTAAQKKVYNARDDCRKSLAGTYKDFAQTDAKMQDNMFLFARCMRGRGMEMPDPPAEFREGAGAGDYIKQYANPGDPDFEKADDACRKEVFGGPTQGPGGQRGSEGGDVPR